MKLPPLERRTLDILADGRWHDGRDLAISVSHRFGSYLQRLRNRGYKIETRRDPQAPQGQQWYQYRWTEAE